MPQYRHAIVAFARWETDAILEWLTYHRSIGFDHVYLYCNDDDPTEPFDRVCPFLGGPAPFVTFNHYPVQGRQWETYLHWFRSYTSETEWVAFLDIDEFLALPGTENVGHYIEQFPPACDAIHVHWIYYGPMGFATRPPGSVLRQYTRRQAWVSLETKTIVRPDRIQPDVLDKRYQQAFWHLWDVPTRLL
jgi:hypothetical protein